MKFFEKRVGQHLICLRTGVTVKLIGIMNGQLAIEGEGFGGDKSFKQILLPAYWTDETLWKPVA